MSNIKSESLVWLDNLAALEAQLQKTPSATHTQLADALNLKRPYVSLLLALKPILDPAAIEKVRLTANSGFVLSFNGAKALIPLGKMADPSGAVHSALDIILSRRLATKYIAALVDWMVSGKPAETFDPKAKRPKPVRFVPQKVSAINVSGPHGQALLDYLIERGLKSPAREDVFTKLYDFKLTSRLEKERANDSSSGNGQATVMGEFKAYLKKLSMDYEVKLFENEKV